MRRRGQWGLIVCLGLVLGTPVWATDPDDAYDVEKPPPAQVPHSQRPGLIDYLFGWSSPPAKAGADPHPAKPKAPPTMAQAPKEERPTPAAERERQAFLRRLAVCDRLHEIAEQTKDEKLRQLADVLQDRAWQLCAQKAHLDTAGMDEAVLNNRVGETDSGTTLASPNRSTAATRSGVQNQARLKENEP